MIRLGYCSDYPFLFHVRMWLGLIVFHRIGYDTSGILPSISYHYINIKLLCERLFIGISHISVVIILVLAPRRQFTGEVPGELFNGGLYLAVDCRLAQLAQAPKWENLPAEQDD